MKNNSIQFYLEKKDRDKLISICDSLGLSIASFCRLKFLKIIAQESLILSKSEAINSN